MATILPLAYLPSVSWFAALRQFDDCVIDLGEHFIKRSERNRARILAPDGVMDLTVQVSHADRPRTPMREVRIDYSKRWQHQHWGALVASYKASPFFDHYAPELEPVFRKEWTHLVDLNLELVAWLCRRTNLPMPRLSEHYIDATPADFDLRPKHLRTTMCTCTPYVQVFADRQPFAADLSFIDLLFAEGPAAASVVADCRYGR